MRYENRKSCTTILHSNVQSHLTLLIWARSRMAMIIWDPAVEVANVITVAECNKGAKCNKSDNRNNKEWAGHKGYIVMYQKWVVQ